MSSSGLNKVILIGNLGADPETRHSAGGSQVTNIRVATSESWKDQSGEKQEKTEWHRITFFGRLAEIASEYLRKGSMVYIEGRIETSKYDKDGETRYSTAIVAKEMQMLGGKSSGAPERSQAGQEASPPESLDDDIPF